MLAQEINQIDWTEWAPYVGPAVGLFAAGLIFWFGLRRSQRGRAAAYDPDAAQPGKKSGDQAVDPFLQGMKRERRSALRRSGNPVAILISDAEVRNAPSHG